MSRLETTLALKAILQKAFDIANLPDDAEQELLSAIKQDELDFRFKTREQQVAILYLILTKCIRPVFKEINVAMNNMGSGSFESRRAHFIDTYLQPILNYLHDNLDEHNTTLYLIERYKLRTESFFKESLLSKYHNCQTQNYEKIFDDDLRLFLFDQGIDNALSTPSSASGRADVVGLLDTKDPLIVEVKIWDSDKNYKKDRVHKGFNQIVQYVNDFNKSVGYLVIYNCNNVEIVFKSDEESSFPYRICFNNKVYYFIVVNLFTGVTASKQGMIAKEEITKEMLIRELQENASKDFTCDILVK